MKCIFTYYPGQDKRAGFLNQRDLFCCLSLSVAYAKKQFKKVELVTNLEGAEVMKDIGFTNIDTSLEGLNIPEDLWAYYKVKAYATQKDPFVHLDLDVILWQKIPRNILKSPIFFQNLDTPEMQPGYSYLVNFARKSTVGYYLLKGGNENAFNCGVVGANDLDIIKDWHDVATEFLFTPENYPVYADLTSKTQLNYLFEQFFIACLAKNRGVEPKFLIENLDYFDVTRPKFKMSHFWGETKRSAEVMDSLYKRLKKEFPKQYKKVMDVPVNENWLLEGLLDKGNDKYKSVLKKALRTKDIKSIVYLGYGGWESSRYVDVTGKKVDFLYADSTKQCIPKCDLVIVKDLVLPWGPDKMEEFLKNGIPAKYILDGEGVFKL